MKADLKKGEKVAAFASVATIFLALLKGIVGYISGSVVLMADAIHSSADFIAIFASWFGLKIAQRKANEKFPYGYYKAENLATLIISAFILYAAYDIFIESYKKLFTSEPLNIPLIALAVALFSAIASFVIAWYEKKVGEEINSQSLIANAEESKFDVLASLVVFAGILFSYFKVPYVESIIGFLLALVILKIAFTNGKLSIYALMDASLNKELEKDIKRIITQTKGVKSLSNLKLRQSGPFVFGEVKVEVSKTLDINRAHEISSKIEQKVKEKHKEVESFTIHIEPYKKSVQRVLIPIKEDKGLNSPVVGHFGRACCYFIADVAKNKIKSWYIKENPFKAKEVRAGLAATKELLKENIDATVLKRIGEISFHTLRDGLVDIYFTDGKTVKEVLDKFMKGELKILSEPTHSSDKDET